MIIKKLPFSKCIHYVKVLKYGVFSGLNAEKYGPEKTQYVDTFQAVVDASKVKV